jgi:catechol 2,3-dioxygenase-like lactoylglutathione lyase family enzyme
MVTNVKFVSIPTRDQDRALAFWTEKVGLKLVTDQPMSATQRWIELRVGQSDTKIVLFTPDGQEDRIGGFFNGALASGNVRKTYEELKVKGVEFTSEPKEEPWGTFVTFKDPDGNMFLLSSR